MSNHIDSISFSKFENSRIEKKINYDNLFISKNIYISLKLHKIDTDSFFSIYIHSNIRRL